METIVRVMLAASPTWDVVVYGSSPAGIAAATAAGMLGMKTALYEPLPMIGGMGAAGFLGLHDGGFGAITGLAYNYTLLNGEYYNSSSAAQQVESFASAWSMNKMLSRAGVTHIQLDCRLTAAASAGVPSKVTSITVLCEKEPVTATVFIDASYDGEIMVALDDVSYTWGRESIAHYNESYAGARVPGWHGVGGPRTISALKDDGSLIKYVSNLTDLAPAGEADDALMAFQHRLCVAGLGNMVPWPKPLNYDPEDFLLMQRCVDANFSGVMTSMPPSEIHDGGVTGKKKYCSCCGISVCASDQPTLNKGWANASWERKQEIIADHTYFEIGSYYYLANDPQVHPEVRARFSSYGLCADEYEEYGHIPPQLYVRISNRLVGDYVMTQNNIAAPQRKPDSIAVGDWSFDEHMTGKYAVNGHVVLEGNFWPTVTKHNNWYDVPYKIMVPKRGTGANLLVPVALSASAMAYTSTRIESMFMATGSAAAVAAEQLVNGDAATVQDVNVTKVQVTLTSVFNQQVHGPPAGPGPLYAPTLAAGPAEYGRD